MFEALNQKLPCFGSEERAGENILNGSDGYSKDKSWERLGTRASALLSEGPWSAWQSVLGQDTEPQTALDVHFAYQQPPSVYKCLYG